LIALALFLKTGSKRTCDFKYLQAILKAPMTGARGMTALPPVRSIRLDDSAATLALYDPACAALLRQSQWTRPSKSSTPAR
jgi:hypothetical protein